MSNFELVINIIVIVLLMLTIIYIWRLNRNISILRNKQESMASLAQSLSEAASKTESTIINLRAVAHETARNIHNLVEEAEQTGHNLNNIISPDDSSQPKSDAELELIETIRALRKGD